MTRTPLTMHADASIRASSTLLSSISSDKIMEQFMGGLDLCLLWDLVRLGIGMFALNIADLPLSLGEKTLDSLNGGLRSILKKMMIARNPE